ncbi:MAG: ferrochelatase [Methylococcaceae bacterium]|nr:ferrochelatase [Methylococcaceae bacterium]
MATEQGKTGILLVNLGTPEAPTPAAVRRYLAEFLWDPRVVEIPRAIWWLILHGIVLRVRPRKSAKAYQAIWTERGSPLMAGSEALADAIAKRLLDAGRDDCVVAVAMRYGRPAVAERLESLRAQGVTRLVVLPLYPQYAAATTASTFDAVNKVLGGWRYIPELRFISDYHSDPGYIRALADSVQDHWRKQGRGELLLLSFHGLPARSRRQGDPYYDQCLRSADLLAAELGLAADRWKVVFQSRFGSEEWLKPYCVEVLQELPSTGVKSVDVICPGFSVDCLETLEEIAIANREVFLEAGGERYRYIPALNAGEPHAQALASLIARQLN